MDKETIESIRKFVDSHAPAKREAGDAPLRFYGARKSHNDDYLIVTFVEGEGEGKTFRRWVVPVKGKAKEGRPYVNVNSIVVPVVWDAKPAKKPEGKDDLPF